MKWKLVLAAGVLGALLGVLAYTARVAPPSGGSGGSASEGPRDAARFTIGTQVIVQNPPRFGLNFDFPTPNHWNGSFPENQWNTEVGFEPVRFRHMDFAKSGGADFLNNPPAQGEEGPGTGYWNSFLDGWFDGADIRIYRQAPSGAVSLLRKDKVKKFTGGDRSENKIYLEKEGPEIKAGDLYVLDITLANLRRTRQQSDERHPFDREPDGDPQVKLTVDEQSFAPEGGSTASLKVALAGGGQARGIGRWFMGLKQDGKRRPDWSRFPNKATFRFSLWLRQEKLPTGKITLAAGSNFQRTFSATREWKQYHFDFTAVTPDELCRLTLTAVGPGTFWVDNFVLYDTAFPLHALQPKYLQALKEFRPGHLRMWSGLNQGSRGGQSLDSWLAGPFAAKDSFNWDEARMPAIRPDLSTILRLCHEVGANPWLIVSPTFSGEEFLNLMEYLGGPASTPYGKLRKSQGRDQPWLEAFDNLYLEFGNEQWNQTFSPLAFPDRPKFYGGLANLAFRTMSASPYFQREKISFAVGGWVINPEWNRETVKHAPLAHRIGFANYCGGWDGKTIVSKSADEMYFNVLNYNPRILIPFMEQWRAAFFQRGPLPVVYEAGPGYQLPEADKPADAVEEALGKSLASAVTTLDSFLYNASRGFGAQCFFMFRPGTFWATHAWEHDFRPHAAFLALQMRNTLCAGNMIEVKTMHVPKIDLPAAITKTKEELPAVKGVPTVTVYAFQQEKKYAFVLLSRELKQRVKVTLDLPYEPQAQARLYKLTAAKPSASNTSRTEVPIEEGALKDFTKSYTIELPPFSVYLIQNEAR